jgi:molybdenum cofactor cytidylyltransferase
LRAVAAALRQHPVAVPVFQGARGHPVAFSAACRDALLDLKGNQGAALVLRAYQAINSVAFLALDDIGIVTDVDTVDDLARAEALLAAR